MDVIDTRFERFRVRAGSYRWLWRLLAALVLGGIVFVLMVPWATAQRGYTAYGGEYLLMITVVVLPFCLFRHL